MPENHHGGSFPSLAAFVSTASRVVATGQDLDEANTKAKLITPLLRTLGWRVHDNTEVLLEYSGDEDFDDRVDYALFGPDGLYAVVEAKQIGRDITEDTTQLRRYMRLFGAQWGVLTNGEEYIVYEASGDSEETLVDRVSVADVPDSKVFSQLTRTQAYDSGGDAAAPADADDTTPDSTSDAATTTADRSTAPGTGESSTGSGDDAASPHDDQQPVSAAAIEAYANEKRLDDAPTPKELPFTPLYESLLQSLAPSVYGRDAEKFAVLCSLVSGVPKRIDTGTRGAIHVLLVHDPGTQVRDLVEHATTVAPDAVALSAGTRAQSLFRVTGGDSPLPQSDVSAYPVAKFARATHAVIHRLDDLSEDGVEKLDTVLNADVTADTASTPGAEVDTTGIIAAAQPEYNRFDEFEPFSDQIGLSPAFISGVDVLFAVPDTPRSDGNAGDVDDEEKAGHVLDRHHTGEIKTRNAHDAADSDGSEAPSDPVPVDATFLHAYLSHARENYIPTLTTDAKQALQSFYTDVRAETDDADVPMPIATEDMASLIRIAEASARLRLSDTVEKEDAVRAMYLLQTSIESVGGDIDMDAGPLQTHRNEDAGTWDDYDVQTVYDIVDEKAVEHDDGVPFWAIIEKASEHGIDADAATAAVEKLQRQDAVSDVGDNCVVTNRVRPAAQMYELVEAVEGEYDEGAPVDVVVERFEEWGFSPGKAEYELDKLRQKGEVYEPRNNHLRTT